MGERVFCDWCNRTFKANLQKVTVFEGSKKVRKMMCTRCIRTMVKTPA